MTEKMHSSHRRRPPASLLRGRLSACTGRGALSSSSSTSLTSNSTPSLSSDHSSRSSSSSLCSALSNDKGNDEDEEDDVDWEQLVKTCTVIIRCRHPRYVEVQAVLNALKPVAGHAHRLKSIHLRRLKRYALDTLPYAKYPPSPIRGPKVVAKRKSSTPDGTPPRSRSKTGSISSAGSLLKRKRSIDVSSISSLERKRAIIPSSQVRPSGKRTGDHLDGVDKVLEALTITTPHAASQSAQSTHTSHGRSPHCQVSTQQSAGIPTKRNASPSASLSQTSSVYSSDTMVSDSDSSSSNESTASFDPQREKAWDIVLKFTRQARDVLLMYQNEILG